MNTFQYQQSAKNQFNSFLIHANEEIIHPLQLQTLTSNPQLIHVDFVSN